MGTLSWCLICRSLALYFRRSNMFVCGNHGNVEYAFWKDRSAVSSVCSFSCVKNVKETGIPIDKPKHEKTKTLHTPENIAAVWQKVCMQRQQHQFTVIHNNWTFRRHYWHNFNIKTIRNPIVQELKPIDHSMRFRFAKWACERLTEDINFGKKKKHHLFKWRSFWSCRVCKQAKFSHLEYSQ